MAPVPIPSSPLPSAQSLVDEGLHLLLVEDDRIYQTFLEGILQTEIETRGSRLTITTAGSLAEARLTLHRESIDAVLLDLNLPDSARLDTLISVLETRNTLPVVVLSADDDHEMSLAAVAAGAQDYIFKGNEDPSLILRTIHHSIERKRITEELRRANLRYQRDLKAATQVQRSLLPSDQPSSPGVKWAWDYRPASELAGDIFHCFEIDANQIGAYLVDVSGHGVSAALLAVQVSRMLMPAVLARYLNPEDLACLHPSAVLSHLNTWFSTIISTGQFFTISFVVLDKRSASLRMSSAGHPPAILMSATGDTQEIVTHGLPIGVQIDYQYDEKNIQLQRGDSVVMYSDGIIEAASGTLTSNEGPVPFGRQQLLKSLSEKVDLPIGDALRHVMREVDNWSAPHSHDDDCTMLAFSIESLSAFQASVNDSA